MAYTTVKRGRENLDFRPRAQKSKMRESVRDMLFARDKIILFISDYPKLKQVLPILYGSSLTTAGDL